ncbi:MGDG synthase family glycosyltransferase [Ectobacillus panaciterrae]|uniref:MGDG synthase family glycosyltransferase n=1 Tax=Ectobacillus panaciterrae TaxID=363872 RepID=UPI0004179096|nr:glycosyltransferase [Ectobacillus panaciterrae]
MRAQPKVLLFTASFGNGHNQVSHALKHTFQELGVGTVDIYDLYAEAYPYWNEAAKFLYKQSFTVGPSLYKLFFYGMDKMYGTKAGKLYCRLGEKKLETIIRDKNPDIVITTFPVGTVPEWRRRSRRNFRIYTVVTDYCLHSTWVHPEIDRYYVATEDVKQKIVKNGILPEDIYVSGIPIRKAFETERNTEYLLNKYGLQPHAKRLLIMAGAQGVVKNVKWIAANLLERSDMEIVIVCGRNQQLYNQLNKLKNQHPQQLKLFGYVEDVHELYELADAMITKPGGITLSETIATKLPTILYKPVPGQEKENSLYFCKIGAAITVRDKESIVTETLHLLQHAQKLSEMRQALGQVHRQESAKQIVSDILHSFSQNPASFHFA